MDESQSSGKRERNESSASHAGRKRPRMDERDLGCPVGFYLNKSPHVAEKYNTLSLSLDEIVSGEITKLVVFNYMIDLEWFLCICPTVTTIPEVHLVHGERDPDRRKLLQTQTAQFDSMHVHSPHLPIPYGTHHTKMFLIYYASGLRVVVCTLNVLERDWLNKTQGIWVQDFPLKTQSSSKKSSFENDLLEYLNCLSGIRVDFSDISKYDMSIATGQLIASVPGYHKGAALHRWGHMRLRTELSRVEIDKKFDRSPAIMQFSSMGSVTVQWLEELSRSMMSSKRSATALRTAPPRLRLLWPTVDMVRHCVEGYAGGGSLPLSTRNAKDFLQRDYFFRWDGAPSGRERCIPHIKTYTRLLNDGQIAWFLLTSANCSKAAWGALQKKGSQLMIRSYELGVLLIPSDYPTGDLAFSCTEMPLGVRHRVLSDTPKFRIDCDGSSLRQTAGDSVVFPVPMEIRNVKKYSDGDEPWICDKSYSDPDILGQVCC
eukprot:158984_1